MWLLLLFAIEKQGKKEFFPKGVKGLREAFCCFSPPKSREKRVFSERRKRTSRGFLLLFATEKQRKRKKIVHVLLGPKVPKASARRFPREGARRGAARGAQDQAYALPRDGRAAARTLFFRVKRECGFIVPPLAAFFILFGNAPRHSFPARRVPTWFRWRESGRRAESASGGDGLLANPRSRPTPLSDVRTPTSESVGWLLLLFDTEKQLKRKSFPQEDRKSQKVFERTFAAYAIEKQRKKKKYQTRFSEKCKVVLWKGAPKSGEKKRFTMKHKKACRIFRQAFRCDGNRSRSV